MDKQIMKTFRIIAKANDKIIQTCDSVQQMCFILDKGKVITPIAMMFKNSEEKEMMRDKIKKFVAESKCKAYILIHDSIMTMIDAKTGKHETQDVVVRSIFTPKEKYIEIVTYKDKKIIEKKKFSSKEAIQFRSEWNIWEDVEIKDYDNSAYEKIKRDNPDEYKDVI